MKTVKEVQTRPEYTGPLPSPEDLDTSCTEVMESPFPTQLARIADESNSMKALLSAVKDTCEKYRVPKPIAAYQGHNLLCGVMIGILAERKRARGVQ